MQTKGFLKSGHTPTLFCAFLYFDISFMIWVLLAPLAPAAREDMKWGDAEHGLLLAVAPLGGAILRILLGLLADLIGPKRTGILGMLATVVPLLLGWLWADSYDKLLVVGLLLGVAGASFAVALPMASRWYPPQYQGLALGIAGAGNSGTALATLFGPMLAKEFGWHSVFGFALIPLLLVFVAFIILAKDSPSQPKPKKLREYAEVLGKRDAWLFCLFYTITFGGFLGFCLFLPTLFKSGHYGQTQVVAGYLATACVFAGSFLRPFGGHFADRIGGVRMLTILYFGLAVLMALMATLPPLYLALAIMFVAMGLFGMGNGSVFQLVPLRFPREIGVLTGLAGAAGGIGGFLLNVILGKIKGWTDSFAWGFVVFSLAALVCGIVIAYLGRTWIPQPKVEPKPEPSPTPEPLPSILAAEARTMI